jgi:hypothetical protein
MDVLAPKDVTAAGIHRHLGALDADANTAPLAGSAQRTWVVANTVLATQFLSNSREGLVEIA